MKVNIIQMGHALKAVEINENSTVREILEKADLDAEHHIVTLNGREASLDDTVHEGDIIGLAPIAEVG